MKKQIVLLTVMLMTHAANAAFDFTLSGTEYNSMVLNNQSLLVTGGGAGQITALDNSYVEVWGTTPLAQFSGIYSMNLARNSTLNYYGGETGAISIYEQATAVLEGGRIDYIASHQYLGSPHIEMVVKDYSYNPGTNLLTGIWGDDTAFSIELVDQAGYDPVIDNIAFTVVPEPMTLLLFGLGGLVIRRKL
jgi:hypothetical protein